MASLGTADGVVARVEESRSRRGVVEVRGLERRCMSEGVVIERGAVGGLNGLGFSSGRRKVVRRRIFCWDDRRNKLTKRGQGFLILGE